MPSVIEVILNSSTVEVTPCQRTVEVIQGINVNQDLSSYATISFVTGISGELASQIGQSNGVLSLNGQNGHLFISGIGGTNVSLSGSTFLISGAAVSGYLTSGQANTLYYPLTNPSGYITGINTGILTGAFYPLYSNPAGYLTGFNSGNYVQTSQTGNFATQLYVNNASGDLSNRLVSTGTYLLSQIAGSTAGVSSINSLTGGITLTGAGNITISSTSSIITISGSTQSISNVVYTTGNQTVSGIKTFVAGIAVPFISGGNSGLIDAEGLTSVDWTGRILRNPSNNVSIDWGNAILKDSIGSTSILWGSRVMTDGAGLYSIEWRDRLLRNVAQSISLNWESNILSGNWLTDTTPSLPYHIVNYNYLTGITGSFYSISNPSGFLSTGQTGQFASNSNLTATGSGLQNQINLITSWTGQTTGLYYPLYNPSGYLTGFNSGLYVLASSTGQFYSASNPSGFITGVNLTNYITTSQTGLFYATNNPSGYIRSSDTGVLGSTFSKVLVTGQYISTPNLTGLGNIFVTTGANGLVNISGSGGGGGEVNTASNLGAGSGIFSQKSSVDLQFKSLKVGGTGLQITGSSTELSINFTGSYVTPSQTGALAAYPYNFFGGFNYYPSGTGNIVVTTGAARDTGDNYNISYNGVFVKSIGSVWASGMYLGGLDVGSRAANQSYLVFAISNPNVPGSFDVLFSTSANPTLPNGYSACRRIGAFTTDSSSNIRPFFYNQKQFIYTDTGVLDYSSTIGSASRTLIPIYVPTGICVIANIVYSASNATSNVAVNIQSPWEPDAVVSVSAFPLSTTRIVGTNLTPNYIQKMTDISGRIGARATVNTTALNVATLGWIDDPSV